MAIAFQSLQFSAQDLHSKARRPVPSVPEPADSGKRLPLHCSSSYFQCPSHRLPSADSPPQFFLPPRRFLFQAHERPLPLSSPDLCHIFVPYATLYRGTFVSRAIPISIGNRSACAPRQRMAAVAFSCRNFRNCRCHFLTALRHVFFHNAIVRTERQKCSFSIEISSFPVIPAIWMSTSSSFPRLWSGFAMPSQ